MTMSFAVKDGVPSMRFETHDSASMLFRSVDIDLVAFYAPVSDRDAPVRGMILVPKRSEA